jgi:hypothetical protein
MRKLATLLALLLVTTAACAQPSARQLELASKLVDILQMRTAFNAYLKQCTNPEGSSLDPHMAYSASPNSFGGITPKSAYWPEVEQLYRRYQQQACGYITVEEFEKFYTAQYAAETSEEDLKAAISFYSSAAGKRYVASTIKANEEFQRYAGKQMVLAASKAYGPVNEGLQSLILKYQKNPK